jgi:acylphosphatase
MSEARSGRSGSIAEKAVRVRVDGLVQGVYFRASARQVARGLEIKGWVRNRRDGGVEVFLQGPAGAVDAMVDWCHHGPPGARVDRVTVEPAAPDVRWFDFSVAD